MSEKDKVTEALDFLESKGFYIRNLWHIQDVQEKFECTEEEALEVLEEAVSGDYICEHITERIIMFGDKAKLVSKEG